MSHAAPKQSLYLFFLPLHETFDFTLIVALT